jgi:hypothetical protein
VPKVQLLRFLNLSENPEVLAPGDLRLWKALGHSLPELTFIASRVLCIEWPDSVDSSRVPDLNFWNERLALSGLSSLALSTECDTPCLQRRRFGSQSSELEVLLEETLRDGGFKENFEVWEARHFEIQSRVDVETLEENVLKLIMLESRSGLVDKDSEDIRFVRPGETWSWTRRSDFGRTKLALGDLVGRFKDLGQRFDDYDVFRRPYQLREQHPRGPAQVRQGESLRSRLAAMQERGDQSPSTGQAYFPSGALSSIVGFHRHSDLVSALRDLDMALRKCSGFSDDDLGPIHWLDVSHHHTAFCPVSMRRQNYRKGSLSSGQLFGLNPIHGRNALLWRRLGALLEMHRDLFSELPWIFSGRETWLASFRDLIAAHRSWELSENSLRQVFAWESERVVPQSWILFSSAWNEDRVRDAFRDFGFEVVLLGRPQTDKEFLSIVASDGTVLEKAWGDVLPQVSELAASTQHVSLSWTSPDIKTPTYGFEKVSIFPDQYLLRLTKSGAKGMLSRRLEFEWRSSARAREVSMRTPTNTPVSARKWADKSGLWVDSLVGGAPAAVADPKAASIIAFEACYRNLVARGVDPRSQICASFSLNKPVLTNSIERDAPNFGAYVLAAEGFVESIESLDNVSMNEVVLDRTSSALRDYECEPVAHLRARAQEQYQAALPGFRMTGEVLYAIGPRPAFMDIGSGILQHVRVVSNHVTRLNWTSQLELYDLVYRCLQEQIITDLRPIMWGGIAEVLLEMGLWSGIGVQLKPALSTIELFSAAPGRFLVGVLPQEAKKFEALVKGEWLTPVGTTGGEKLFGLPLERYREERGSKVSS